MERIGIAIVLCLKILSVENFMIQSNFPRDIEDSVAAQDDYQDTPEDKYENSFGLIGLNRQPNREHERVHYKHNKHIEEHTNKPCLVVIVSNGQNPAMQSLLRTYRYDANGILIPSSVKYYIKTHKDLESTPHLVPLTGKSFTPLGGFVRYYKEVPPIPHSL